MKNLAIHILLLMVLFFPACREKPVEKKLETNIPGSKKDVPGKIAVADNNTILSRKEVPILCYHRIHNFNSPGSDRSKGYQVTPAAFAEQMKALSDSGYHTILPDQLYDYLTTGAAIPEKPVMITFDDTHEEQFSIGNEELKKYGYKGVYFIMTISLNRNRYMSKDQVRQLSDEGNAICCHTWDHHMVTKYQGADWDTQLVKPQRLLEGITGKPVHYFAYPFGLWNQAAIPELKSRGYKLAFILSSSRDSTEPLYTVRRMLVPGNWTTPGMLKAMRSTFHLEK
jgi:peptidoglycan/xylan/chitin deacetylase (PgdA/CDA1 family)